MALVAVSCAIDLLRIGAAAASDDLSAVEELVADGDRFDEHAARIAAEIEDEALQIAELIDGVGEFAARGLLELGDVDVADARLDLVFQIN